MDFQAPPTNVFSSPSAKMLTTPTHPNAEEEEKSCVRGRRRRKRRTWGRGSNSSSVYSNIVNSIKGKTASSLTATAPSKLSIFTARTEPSSPTTTPSQQQQHHHYWQQHPHSRASFTETATLSFTATASSQRKQHHIQSNSLLTETQHHSQNQQQPQTATVPSKDSSIHSTNSIILTVTEFSQETLERNIIPSNSNYSQQSTATFTAPTAQAASYRHYQQQCPVRQALP
ncbi:uncharacterized protein [Macrobrachium rosenbergii]|uniref:uncharacterized protein n=1 Tax=Macrobrachium rosenbergii TaxID=79674 RepID=UPI0034D4DE5C